VKVVQAGSLTKRVACKRCKSELEYEPEDVKSTTYLDDGDGVSDITYHVQCPLCLTKLGPSGCFVYVARPSAEAASVSCDGPQRMVITAHHGRSVPHVTLIVPVMDSNAPCPSCGHTDIAAWADDGESDAADWWECESCGHSGAFLHTDPNKHTTPNGLEVPA